MFATKADFMRYISDHLTAAGVTDPSDVRFALAHALDWDHEHGPPRWDEYDGEWATQALDVAIDAVRERWAREWNNG